MTEVRASKKVEEHTHWGDRRHTSGGRGVCGRDHKPLWVFSGAIQQSCEFHELLPALSDHLQNSVTAFLMQPCLSPCQISSHGNASGLVPRCGFSTHVLAV